MGCDIHAYAERRTNDGYKRVEINDLFGFRDYGIFGFLADVRNYSSSPFISAPRGLPKDVSADILGISKDWGTDSHSHSWLTVEELSSYPYDERMEDRRCTKEVSPGLFSGGETCDPGEGEEMTFRDFLGEWFFKEIAKLKEAKADRIVFFFDN